MSATVGSAEGPSPHAAVWRQDQPFSRPDLSMNSASRIELAGSSDADVVVEADRVDCAVIVVTYNSANSIVGLLDSLPGASDGITLRTIIVDNGSSDATCELVRGRVDVTLIETGANLGYAGGINVGRDHVGPFEMLLVLNPDMTLAPGAIAELAQALRDPDVGMAVPRILNAAGETERSLRREPTVARAIGDALLGGRLSRRPGWMSEMVWDDKAYMSPHSIDWATGAAVLVSAECDVAVGAWDERFFLYSEEVDYAARVRAAGFRIEYVPSAKVHHQAGGSGASDQLVALLAVNRIRYAAKWQRRARFFRVAVTLHELLRAGDSSHRFALKTVVARRRWSTLPSSSMYPGPSDGRAPSAQAHVQSVVAHAPIPLHCSEPHRATGAGG